MILHTFNTCFIFDLTSDWTIQTIDLRGLVNLKSSFHLIGHILPPMESSRNFSEKHMLFPPTQWVAIYVTDGIFLISGYQGGEGGFQKRCIYPGLGLRGCLGFVNVRQILKVLKNET